MAQNEFNTLAQQQYDTLVKQEAELKAKLSAIQKQKAPLKKYLQGAGLILIKHRGPRKKKI